MKHTLFLLLLSMFSLTVSAQRDGILHAAHRASAADFPIITEQPEGEVRMYSRAGHCYLKNGQTLLHDIQTDSIMIVYAPDGETVYLKDPVSRYTSGAWVRGTYNGSTITVPLGQNLSYSEQYKAALALHFVNVTINPTSVKSSKDTETTEAVYTVEDNVITLQNSSQSHPLGVVWTDDNTWQSYGDYESVYTLAGTGGGDNPDTPDIPDGPSYTLVTPPAGLQTEEWHMTGVGYLGLSTVDHTVALGFDGNDLYIKGISEDFPDAWVKGTLDGDLATFPKLQYLGKYAGPTYTGRDTWFTGATTTDLQDYRMTYDKDNKTLKNERGNYLTINISTEDVRYLLFLQQVEIAYTEAGEAVAETATPVEVPYYNDFATEEKFRECGVIDSNRDTSTWQYSDEEKLAEYHWNLVFDADDWLVTPAVHLEAGRRYSITFDAAANSNDYPEKFEVLIGTEPKASAMQQKIIEPTQVSTMDFVKIENKEIVVAADGYYHFGIHAISAANSFNLKIDNLAIEQGADDNAPDAVSNLDINADPQGKLLAAVIFDAPTKSVGGNDITEMMSVRITRNGKLAGTVNAMPGEKDVTFVDSNVDINGDNLYVVTPYYGEKPGNKVEKTAYIGIDVPLPVDGIAIKDHHNSVEFTWNAVADKGTHNQFVDVNAVQYDVYTMYYSTAFDEYLLDQRMTTKSVSDCNFTFRANTDEGEQQFRYFSITAKNTAGQSVSDMVSMLVGAPYKLPFAESFAKKELHSLWTTDLSEGMSTGFAMQATDGDNSSFRFVATGNEAEGVLTSGKITLNGATNATLMFDAKAVNSNNIITVKVIDAEGNTTDVETITLTSAFETYNIPLSNFADQRWIRLAFAVKNNAGASTYIDNVSVMDYYSHNLVATLSAPSTVKAGESARVKVTVVNEGQEAAESYVLTLSANDVVIYEEECQDELEPFGEHEYFINYIPSVFDETGEVLLSANVEYDLDLKPEDNIDETLVTVTAPTVAAPVNLVAEPAEGGIALSWEAPAAQGITAYNVYIDEMQVGSVAAASTSYIYNGALNGIHRISITAIYGSSESAPATIEYDSTGIGMITAGNGGYVRVYTIDGKRMDTSKKLPSGTYIANGNKFIVK